jgi:hypothetical protein
MLFSDDSVWRNAEDRPVSDYARDLHAATVMGGGGVSSYTIPYPPRRRGVPDWARGLVCSARALHELQRQGAEQPGDLAELWIGILLPPGTSRYRQCARLRNGDLG